MEKVDLALLSQRKMQKMQQEALAPYSYNAMFLFQMKNVLLSTGLPNASDYVSHLDKITHDGHCKYGNSSIAMEIQMEVKSWNICLFCVSYFLSHYQSLHCDGIKNTYFGQYSREQREATEQELPTLTVCVNGSDGDHMVENLLSASSPAGPAWPLASSGCPTMLPHLHLAYPAGMQGSLQESSLRIWNYALNLNNTSTRVGPYLKGSQKILCLNLIFWDMMGRGIAHFGRRGL